MFILTPSHNWQPMYTLALRNYSSISSTVTDLATKVLCSTLKLLASTPVDTGTFLHIFTPHRTIIISACVCMIDLYTCSKLSFTRPRSPLKNIIIIYTPCVRPAPSMLAYFPVFQDCSTIEHSAGIIGTFSGLNVSYIGGWQGRRSLLDCEAAYMLSGAHNTKEHRTRYYQGWTLVSPYVGMAQKQDGGSNGCISNYRDGSGKQSTHTSMDSITASTLHCHT